MKLADLFEDCRIEILSEIFDSSFPFQKAKTSANLDYESLTVSTLQEQRMMLNELGENPLPFTASFIVPGTCMYEFEPNPDYNFKYEVRFNRSYKQYIFTDGYWNVEFGAFGRYISAFNIDPYDLNQLGQEGIVNPVRVFSTIGNVIKDFISKVNPEGLEFTAVDSKRIALYKKITPRLASMCGMTYTMDQVPAKEGYPKREKWLFQMLPKSLNESIQIHGFWITTLPDQPLIYTDHSRNIHHDHLAREHFKQQKPGDPRPMIQALQAGWVRVNIVSKNIGIQFYPDALNKKTIRRLLEFIKDYQDRPFNVDEFNKFQSTTYRELKTRLQDLLKHAPNTLTESARMDSFWITDDQETLYLDHDQGIHHNEVAAGYFPSPELDVFDENFDVNDLPINQALRAGWIRVNTTSNSLNIQFYKNKVRRSTIRKLMQFTQGYKNYPNYSFMLVDKEEPGKVGKISFNELQNTLGYYLTAVRR